MCVVVLYEVSQESCAVFDVALSVSVTLSHISPCWRLVLRYLASTGTYMQEDIFARVEGVESDLEGHSGQQYALEHAVRRCHQPGGQVSIHLAQNRKNGRVEHEKIVPLHDHHFCGLTHHSTFDSKAKLRVSGGFRCLVRLGLQDPRDQHQHRQSPQQRGVGSTPLGRCYLLCLAPPDYP